MVESGTSNLTTLRNKTALEERIDLAKLEAEVCSGQPIQLTANAGSILLIP